jgi:Ca2+-binding EF-hand superfamily protein
MHSQRVPQNAFDIVLTALQNLIGQKRKFYGHTITDTADIFKGIDKDGSGTIDYEEFKGGMERLDIGLSATQIDELAA